MYQNPAFLGLGESDRLPEIRPIARDAALHLSATQQQIWARSVSGAHWPGGTRHYRWRLFGMLDRHKLQAALDRIAARHESLRTTFRVVEGEAFQCIAAADTGFALQYEDNSATADPAAALAKAIGEDALGPVDLLRGPLAHGRLVCLARDTHVLHLALHAAIADEWSMDVLMRELGMLYAQPGLDVPALKVQYADFAHWQRQLMSGARQEECRQFWVASLSGAPERLALPTDRLEAGMHAGATETVAFTLGRELRAALTSLSRRHSTTVPLLVASAWAVLLSRLSGQEDIVLELCVPNRPLAELEGVIGAFANSIPLRVDLAGNPKLETVLAQVVQREQALRAHQFAPIEQIEAWLAPLRSPGAGPLCQVLLAWQDEEMPARLGDIGLERLAAGVPGSEHDVRLELAARGGEIAGRAVYRRAMFDSASMRRHIAHLQRVLAALARTPQCPVAEVELLGAEELDQLRRWNHSGAAGSEAPYVHRCIELQAAAQPDALAVVFEGQSLTYAGLNRRANLVARRLLERGIGSDDRVAVCIERSLDMVVGMLAVLKAGAAYVPLDPAYPDDRLAYMLDDSAARAVLSQRALRARLSALGSLPFLALDDDAQADPEADGAPDPCVEGLASHHLAYVIYTSGSTGRPKGVMVEHRQVLNLLGASSPWFEFGADDVCALFHSFAFDSSVRVIWGTLMHGGRLHIVPYDQIVSPEARYQLICEAGVTVLNQTPSAFRQLMAAQAVVGGRHCLRQVLLGGEVVVPALVGCWYGRPENAATELVNEYGPTEATVYATWHRIDAREAMSAAIPIGRPVGNVQIHILDQRRRPVPVGVVGEIYIGGAGVARGYLARPELTAQRFQADPFSATPGARCYRTGDQGRYRSDGTIEYLGRNDDQVKIRGFRIELGEIATALALHPAVREAEVLVSADAAGEPRLVAYLATRHAATAEALRKHLAAILPAHMLPAAYVCMERLPLTAHGKLDRRALPEPDLDAFATRTYLAPQGRHEERLAALWQDMLGVARIGRHDHFFDLGGHSLLAVRLLAAMRAEGWAIDPHAFFAEPTLQAVAAAIGRGTAAAVPPNLIPAGCTSIVPGMLTLASLTADDIARVVDAVPGGAANIQDIYALSPLQEGILYNSLASGEGDPYLLCTVMGLESEEAVHRLAEAIRVTVARHDIFRSSLHWRDLCEPVQVVWRAAPLCVEKVALAAEDGSVAHQLLDRFGSYRYRLDLGQAPLMRLVYAHDPAARRWVVLWQRHHLIIDHITEQAWQMELGDILAGRGAGQAAPAPYRNFVAQARLGLDAQEHRKFFSAMLGDVDEPTLPYGVTEAGGKLRTAEQRLDPRLSERLRQQAAHWKVGPAAIMHLAWARVIGALSGRDDVVFGTVLLGRMHAMSDMPAAPGLYINTLPLRLAVGEQSAGEAIRATHQRLCVLLRHEHASLALAQRCSGVPAPGPLFNTLLNYRHRAPAGAGLWEEVELIAVEERTSYPLVLSVDDMAPDFALTVQAAAAAIDAGRVCRYVQRALLALVGALEHCPQQPMKRLPCVHAGELAQLASWNATMATFPETICLHQMVELRAARHPGAIAIVQGATRVSYGELNRNASQLAHYLRARGIAPGARVAICLCRSIEMITAMLAVLKAGAACVPLDPAYPDERVAAMLEGAGAAVVLAGRSQYGRVAGVAGTCPVMAFDDALHAAGALGLSSENLAVKGLHPGCLVYVLFTSGSTGRPKAVAMPHRALVNLLAWQAAAIPAGTENGRTLHYAALGFDVAFQEIFGALGSGAELVLVEEARRTDFSYLLGFIAEHRIERLYLPYMALQELASAAADDGAGGAGIADLSGLKDVITAGEALRITAEIRAMFARWPSCRLHNHYGPTETHVATAWTLPAAPDRWPVLPPIGKPIANSRIYILDAQRRLAPVGVAGEIHIGGACVAHGYLDQPELTAARFLPDPFSRRADDRLYKTGDLARYRPDGNIEYLGRNDRQLKVRGFRVEPGELEAALASHPAVAEAAVVGRTYGAGLTRLIAYYTRAARPVPAQALRSYLAARVPAHMVPVAFVELEKFPLTASGKLDRRRLPEPSGTAFARQVFEAPRNDVERNLATLWEELLGVSSVSRFDHFFALGGHSLLALRLLAQLRRRHGYELTLATLLAWPVLCELAHELMARPEP